MFSVILFILLIGFWVAFAYFWHRNNKVLEFRLILIKTIHEAAQADINLESHDWGWRYKTFDSVSYDRMIYSFKPLTAEAWYSDTSFLRPSQTV